MTREICSPSEILDNGRSALSLPVGGRAAGGLPADGPGDGFATGVLPVGCTDIIGPVVDLPADDPVDGLATGGLPADGPGDGFATGVLPVGCTDTVGPVVDLPADDPVDGLATGGLPADCPGDGFATGCLGATFVLLFVGFDRVCVDWVLSGLPEREGRCSDNTSDIPTSTNPNNTENTNCFLIGSSFVNRLAVSFKMITTPTL